MERFQPRVTIGLPVYNGAIYLAQTLDSILAQSFTDFELIISDNASTDATRQICEQYCERDSRVAYYRNEQNLGAAANYNRLVDLAQGEYFKWIGHDDPIKPRFLEECIRILDRDDTVGLCYPRTQLIDEAGNDLRPDKWLARHFTPRPRLQSSDPAERFFASVVDWWSAAAIFGVYRTSVLRKTGLIGSFIGSDVVTVAEMALLGKIYEVPEALMYRRYHAGQLWKQAKNNREKLYWWDTKRKQKIVSLRIDVMKGFVRSINRHVQNPIVALKCYAAILMWLCKSTWVSGMKFANRSLLWLDDSGQLRAFVARGWHQASAVLRRS